MLWVRSQDNLSLANVIGITVDKIDSEYQLKGYDASSTINNFWWLGTYSNEEKAVKVVDMIEMVIKGTREYSTVPNGYPVVKDRVFQMPADEEVEVD